MDAVSLAAGLLLPWLAGMAALLAAQRRMHSLALPGEIAWIGGAGYLVGAFLLTVWMRTLSTVGIEFGWSTVGAPLMLIAVMLGYVGWRRNGAAFSTAWRTVMRAILGFHLPSPAARLAWRVLLAWIVLRFALLGLEVAWRPLYPWDAWIQWATKARVWYEFGRILPFTSADTWLAGGGTLYFDASPDNPPMMPLLQVWSCIALGRWDDALMNWPWWQIGVALALAVYGALRSLGVSTLGALTGTFLVASLPLANVHVALSGYPDLPMSAYYTVAALAFLRWGESHSWRDGELAIVLALACSQIAPPGLAWALTLVAGVLVVLVPRRGRQLVALGFGTAIFLLVVLARTDLSLAGHRLHLDLDPDWRALGQGYFLLASWHLLWYGALATALLAWRQLVAPPLAPLTAVVASAMLLLLVMLAFPSVRASVAGLTTSSRVTLHLAPLIVIFMVLAFRDLSRDWMVAHPGLTPAPAGTGEVPAR